MSSSAGSAITFNVDKRYDVFLSFRGPDTCQGFVTKLHFALDGAGICTSLDKINLDKGEHIFSSLCESISASRICIPIFSANFAQSKWCLKEVLHMVKSGVRICPVFYDVFPKDLRDGGKYAQNFKQHESEQTLPTETIFQCKSALHAVSNLCGWGFNQYSGDTELIQNIVTDVSKILKSNSPVFDIPECFGLDQSVEYVSRLLSVGDDQKMVKVGVHGMSGIGKTTLAKVVYKRFYSQFTASCFVLDVGAICEDANGLVKLQTHMLKDLSKFRGEVDHVDRGKGLLKDCVRGKNILFLLDDIRRPEQLEALLGNYGEFGAGSRLIITSSDQQILKVANVDQQYEVCRLPHEHALQLFNFHAFPDSSCPDQAEMQTLSSNIVGACEGLPLAIRILGKHLVGEGDKNVWAEMVDKLRCEPSLQKKLRTCCYEPLDSNEKKMFQDVACCFTGTNKEIAMIFWGELIPSTHASLRRLFQKSLVNLGPSNELLMNSCLRDLARSIENEMSSEPRKRIRLFEEKDVQHVLCRKRENARSVRYLSYEPMEHKTLKAEMLMPLDNLQLLWLADVVIEGHFSNELYFCDLRWLRWRRCSSRHLPSGMNLNSLVILEVTDSQINHLWDERSEEHPNKRPMKLKVLILSGCASLESLPATLIYSKLQILDLRNCKSLRSLPNTVGNFSSLVSLNMEGCGFYSLPEDFGELSSLKKLNLSWCKHLSKLPASFGNLTQLENLEIHHNPKLTELPDSFGSLKVLLHLNMEGCGVFSLPENYGELSRLRNLNLSWCKHLSKLPASFGKLTQLERLQIHHNPKLTELPASFGGLKALCSLNAGYCQLSDDGLPAGISELCSLRIMHLEHNGFRSLPAGLQKLSALWELHLDGCNQLSLLPPLPPSLEMLYARDCLDLYRLCCLSELKSLIRLDVSKSCHLTELPGLDSLQGLTTLNLVGCKKLKGGTLESCLGGLKSLESAFIGGPGVSPIQLQSLYDSVNAISFNQQCLLSAPHSSWNWVNGEADGRNGDGEKHLELHAAENRSKYCAGYIVCCVTMGQVMFGNNEERLQYTIQRNESVEACKVIHPKPKTDGGDVLEVRVVRIDDNADFEWLRMGETLKLNARSDYENWKACFKFMMYEPVDVNAIHPGIQGKCPGTIRLEYIPE